MSSRSPGQDARDLLAVRDVRDGTAAAMQAAWPAALLKDGVQQKRSRI